MQRFQLDLHQRQPVDQQNDIIAVVAVIGIDAKLVDDFKLVFAPVAQIDQHVFQRSAVLADEFTLLAQGLGGGKYIGGNDLVAQAGEFGVGEMDAV